MATFMRWIGGAALTAACAAVGAQMHQICYEGTPELRNGVWVPNGVFGCAVDGPGHCTISPASAGFIARANPFPLAQFVQAQGTFRYFDFSSSAGSFTARVRFFDSNSQLVAERSCTVNAKGMYTSERGYASPGAVLTGFSTDASGLATSGVWRLQSGDLRPHNRVTVQAPADFVAVGGGAIGIREPIGALIAESARYASYPDDQRSWRARTSEAGGAAQLHQTTAFVIGLRIEGVAARDLAALLRTVVASSSGVSGQTLTAHPSAQAALSSEGVVIGGGFRALAAPGIPAGSNLGQFATAGAPAYGWTRICFESVAFFRCRFVPVLNGWRAESKDHVLSAPGWVETELHALPPTITVAGVAYQLQARHVSATSAVAAHPEVDVVGLRGEYALTAIGATVDWRRYDAFGNQVAAGNLLWKLEPRADVGGASVAAKDHIVSSPASVTAHALGIKLVR